MRALGLVLLLAASPELANDAEDPGEYEEVARLTFRDHLQFANGKPATVRADGAAPGRGHVFATASTIVILGADGRLERWAKTANVSGTIAMHDDRVLFVDRGAKQLSAVDRYGASAALSPTTDALGEAVAVHATTRGYAVTLDVEKRCMSMFCGSKVYFFDGNGRPAGDTESWLFDTSYFGANTPAKVDERVAAMKRDEPRYRREWDAAKRLSAESKKRQLSLDEVVALSASDEQRETWTRRFGNRGVVAREIEKELSAARRRVVELDDEIAGFLRLEQTWLPATARRPCGTDDRGRPLAIVFGYRGAELGVARLDAKLRSAELVWKHRIDDYANAVERFDRHYPTSAVCGASGSVTVIGSEHLGSMAIYEGGRQLSRQLLGAGDNRFAVLREGDVVLALVRHTHGDTTSQVRVFVRRTAKRSGAGDVFLALRDAKTPQQRVELMLEAGWWESARALALESGLDALARRARAEEIAYLSDAGPDFYDDTGIAQKAKEAAELVSGAGSEPIVSYAAALAMRDANDRGAYVRHLEATRAALAANKNAAWHRYPRLFDLFVEQGDVERMEDFVRRLPSTAPPATRARYRATLLRAKRDFAAALLAVDAVKDPPAELWALKARLYADLGRDDDAILAWTRARAAGLEGQPEVEHGIGIAYLRRGLVELAVESLLRAVTASPNDTTYAANLAIAYRALDKREEGLKHLFGALSKAPSDPVLQHLLQRFSAPPTPPKAAGAPLAVLPFGTSGSTTDRLGLADMLAAMTITAISDDGAAEVVERARLEEVLAEQKLQTTAHFDPKTTVKIGKLLGAQRVVAGNVAAFNDQLVIDLRVVEVATGRVTKSASADTKLDVEALRGALTKAVETLLEG